MVCHSSRRERMEQPYVGGLRRSPRPSVRMYRGAPRRDNFARAPRRRDDFRAVGAGRSLGVGVGAALVMEGLAKTRMHGYIFLVVR